MTHIILQPKQVFFVFGLISPSSQITADCYYAAVHLAVQYAFVHSCKKVFLFINWYRTKLMIHFPQFELTEAFFSVIASNKWSTLKLQNEIRDGCTY